MFELSKIKGNELASANYLQNGLFLWVWHPENTPPHIGISTEGKYFSLQLEKLQFGLNVQRLIELVDRKKTSLFWLEIFEDSMTIEKYFKDYQSCVMNNCSCLQPILDIFEIQKNGAILFDLIDHLESKNSLGKLMHKYLPENFTALKRYTRQDVENHLLSLQP